MKVETFLLLFFSISIIKSVKMKQIYEPESNSIQNYNITDSKYYFAYGDCSKSNCDNCISSIVCQCPLGYAQKINEEVTTDKKSCQYKLKKQWIFFLLELLLPFGFGHFYAKRILYVILGYLVQYNLYYFDIDPLEGGGSNINFFLCILYN